MKPNPALLHPTSARSSNLTLLLAFSLTLLGGWLAGRLQAAQVILLADTPGVSVYQKAMDRRGYPYQVFRDATPFSQAVLNADPQADVVVVDSASNHYDFSPLISFVEAGGRALLQYWDLTGGSPLAEAFRVTVTGRYSSPEPIHDWSAVSGISIFRGLRSPISTVESGFNTDLTRLQPILDGQVIAGRSETIELSASVLVAGNSGRTLVQGFMIEDIDSGEVALRLAKNELDYLLEPLFPPNAPSVVVGPRSGSVMEGRRIVLRVDASGAEPLSYQWQHNGADLPDATGESYTIANATHAPGWPLQGHRQERARVRNFGRGFANRGEARSHRRHSPLYRRHAPEPL